MPGRSAYAPGNTAESGTSTSPTDNPPFGNLSINPVEPSLLSQLILGNGRVRRQLRSRTPRRLQRSHRLRAKPALDCGSGSYRLPS